MKTNMFKDLFLSTDSPEMRAGDIVLPDNIDDAFYISESGRLYCYAGAYIPSKREVFFQSSPLLGGKHSNEIGNRICGFFRIEKGCILIDKFIDEFYDLDEKFKKIKDYRLCLPAPGSCYYGVLKNTKQSWSPEEESEVTRYIWGLTHDELDYFLRVYAEVFGAFVSNLDYQYPRLTRSRCDNYCEITDLWIPKYFPYITFNGSGFIFSHVSLFGFYQYIRMLLVRREHSILYQALTQKRFTEKIIDDIMDISDYFPFAKKVIQRDIWFDDEL